MHYPRALSLILGDVTPSEIERLEKYFASPVDNTRHSEISQHTKKHIVYGDIQA